jgi:uncharacterized protein YjiS (DUF1127 family)
MTNKKQVNRHSIESGETVYEMAIAAIVASAALPPRDRGSSPISLLKVLRWWRTTGERYRQRKQLMEMDYRQLKDIGITPEEAQQEARKPIWKD